MRATYNDELRHLRSGLREAVDTLAAYRDALRSATGEVAARLTAEIAKLEDRVNYMRGQFGRSPTMARRDVRFHRSAR